MSVLYTTGIIGAHIHILPRVLCYWYTEECDYREGYERLLLAVVCKQSDRGTGMAWQNDNNNNHVSNNNISNRKHLLYLLYLLLRIDLPVCCCCCAA